MSEQCTHNCETCGSDCGSRTSQDMTAKLNELSSVKRTVGVISGKGGVGKSLVTALLAVLSSRRGNKTAILDADITGPSIPRLFGLKEKAEGADNGIYPVTTKTGVEVMSINLLLQNDTDPVVWRGPVIGGAVTQFWTDVVWGDVDLMLIDMPPGTGDVALTVFQSIPLDGIIIVTTPQELVSMIVAKAVNMANMMDVPVLGIVENMSYFTCPDCGREIELFGKSEVNEVARSFDLPVLARIPISPKLAAGCDAGLIELFEGDWLDGVAQSLEQL